MSPLPTHLQDLLSANVTLILILIVLIQTISTGVVALAYGWDFALVVVLGGVPPLLGAGCVRIRLELQLESKTADRLAESADPASEAVNTIKTVSSLTIDPSNIKTYYELLLGVVTCSIKPFFWTL